MNLKDRSKDGIQPSKKISVNSLWRLPWTPYAMLLVWAFPYENIRINPSWNNKNNYLNSQEYWNWNAVSAKTKQLKSKAVALLSQYNCSDLLGTSTCKKQRYKNILTKISSINIDNEFWRLSISSRSPNSFSSLVTSLVSESLPPVNGIPETSKIFYLQSNWCRNISDVC